MPFGHCLSNWNWTLISDLDCYAVLVRLLSNKIKD
jgi:hypothetical protein